MEPSSKKTISARMNKAAENVLRAGLKKAWVHYAPVLAVWKDITPKQQEEFLAHSPVLAELIRFAQQFEVTK